MKNRKKVESMDDGWPWMGSNKLDVPKARPFSDSDSGC